MQLSLTQQQAMRVCVRLVLIWLDFVSRRLLPLGDGEAAISNLCPIAERLTNLSQNHSAGVFRQVNDQMEGFPPGTLSNEVLSDETLDDWPDKTFCRPSAQVQISYRQHGLVTQSRSPPKSTTATAQESGKWSAHCPPTDGGLLRGREAHPSDTVTGTTQGKRCAESTFL